MRATTIRIPADHIADTLGLLDPKQSARITYEVGDTYLVQFERAEWIEQIDWEFPIEIVEYDDKQQLQHEQNQTT